MDGTVMTVSGSLPAVEPVGVAPRRTTTTYIGVRSERGCRGCHLSRNQRRLASSATPVAIFSDILVWMTA
jgi:hypothetical protein